VLKALPRLEDGWTRNETVGQLRQAGRQREEVCEMGILVMRYKSSCQTLNEKIILSNDELQYSNQATESERSGWETVSEWFAPDQKRP